MAKCGDISAPEQDDHIKLLQEASENEIFKNLLQGTSKKEIVVILAGKSGAGKTTLLQNMVGEDVDITISAKPTTEDIYPKSVMKHGKKLVVYDTPGLIGDEKEKKKALESWFEKLKEKHIDLLVCCVPIGGSAKFEDGYPLIMQCLHKKFGSEIWERCVVVYTFSNQVLGRLQRKCGQENHEQVNAKYIELIQQYSKCFQDELENLNVKNIKIKSIFEWDHERKNQYPGPGIILGIPAGDMLDDRVLPGIEDEIPKWTDVMHLYWFMQCDISCLTSFIEFKYGKEAKNNFIEILGGLIGAGAGLAVGVGVGAAIAKASGKAGALFGGLVGGPVGVVIGALIGTAIGMTVSKAAAKKITQKSSPKDEAIEEKKTK